MDEKKILEIKCGLRDMENNYGWKRLKKEIEEDMDKLMDDICAGTGNQGVDDANRGQLGYAREIFKKIEQIHENKTLINHTVHT